MNKPPDDPPTLEQIYWKEPVDHEGSARCVLALFPNYYKYVPSHGWLAYNGTHWEVDAEASVGRAVVSTLRERAQTIDAWAAGDEDKEKWAEKVKTSLAASSWGVNGVRTRLAEQKEVAATIDQFDQDPDSINVRNGIVDLRTGRLRPHDHDALFTYCLDIDYSPDALSEEWQTFLAESVDGGEMLDYIQTVAGYCLTGHTSEETMFYIYGPTRSGKGTFTEVLTKVMGALAETANFRTFTMERSSDAQNFDLAPLKNKRLVVAGESRKNERINESILKQVTGGDNISCAFKFKTQFSYRPRFKIILASNHPANVDASDEAAWARLQVIHFPHSKLGAEDKDLKRRLKRREALEGVLAWMVTGAIAWYEAGITAPGDVARLTAEQRVTANTVANFVDQCCTTEGDNGFSPQVAGTYLYNKYRQWCKNEGHSHLGRKNFTLSMKDLGYDTTRFVSDRLDKRVRGFEGLLFAGFGEGNESISERFKNGPEVSQNGKVSRP